MLNIRKLTVEIGKKILDKKESGVTPMIMTGYGHYIEEVFKDKPLKKITLIGKINEVIRSFVTDEENE